MHVVGKKVDPWFLFDKLLRDFYQYSMNTLDSISQIANAGLLANNGKKVDSVDFQRIVSTFAQQTYKTAFPKTASWCEDVNNSSEFKYIEAINNRTKHTADIRNKLSIGIFGSSTNAEIGSFFRKDNQHNKRDLTDQLQATLGFLKDVYDEFLTIFCDEFVLNKYVDNRLHKIGGVYQQKIKDQPEDDLSYAFIPVENDFASMPKEIYILLVCDRDEIKVCMCPFDSIVVRKGEHNILGRYKSSDMVGDDCLFGYRKYVKDENNAGPVCMFFVKKEKIIFCHQNPFFDVTTATNDDKFSERSKTPY